MAYQAGSFLETLPGAAAQLAKCGTFTEALPKGG